MEARIVRERIDVNKVVNSIIKDTSSKGAGALVIFIGYVKGVVDNNRVNKLVYTAYEPYASKKLLEIINDVSSEDVYDVRVYHRIGELEPGEPTIYIFVSAENRGIAFDKAREILERVKHEVPIFKLEKREDGDYWVVGDGTRIKRIQK